MRKQTLVFTALPNGVTGSGGNMRLRLSVHISPRLVTDEGGATPPLSLFPDFVDWPSTQISFRVQFGGAAAVAATRVGPAPRSDLWRAAFPNTAFVRPHAFQQQFADAPVQTYPVRNIQSWLKDRYLGVLRGAGTEFPSAQALLGGGGTFAFPSFRDISLVHVGTSDAGPPPLISEEEAMSQQLLAQLTNQKYFPPMPPSPATAKTDFLQLKLFHKPFSNTRVPLAVPQIDVHQVFSSLGEYPVLMRMMGLVQDLEVPYPGALGLTTLQVLPTWTPLLPAAQGMTVNVPNPTGASPRLLTRCFVSSTEFSAAPRQVAPDLAGGMLRLDDATAYDLVQIDPDGAALKAMTFAENLVRARESFITDDTPQNYSVPSLRSAGVGVARVGRGMQAHTSFMRAATNNGMLEGSGDVTLDAEDVTRGFAFDVWNSRSQQWHSLFQRVGEYRFLRTSPATRLTGVEDEGWMSMGVTGAQDGSTPNVKLTEKVVGWEGWSLAAPRPGKTVGADGNPVPSGSTSATDAQLEVGFKAKPGSLPRQRFGITYRMRGRAVDLAGNRLSMEQADAQLFLHATPPLGYGRFEPVSPPAVALRNPLTEGEHPARLVFRSNFLGAPVQPAAVPAQRHIVPDKTSEIMAEWLEQWDNPNSRMVDPGAWGIIQAREGGSFWDIGQPDPNNPDQVVVPRDNLSPVPYLPEFLARGAILRGLPGAAGPVEVTFDYPPGKSWPDEQPFRLVLVEGTAPPAFDRNLRVLTVFLDKADVMPVRLSSHLNPEDTDKMGLVQWLIEALGAAHADVVRVRNEGVQGINWLLTPFKILTLVHAVRQPLLRPRFLALTPDKKLGDTFATLTDDPIEVSRKSTIKLDIFGQWQEPIDSVDPLVLPKIITGKARPFEFPVPLVTPLPAGQVETRLTVTGRHEFGDTKHRDVDYSAIATTRFSEYFVERRRGVTLGATPLLLHAPVVDDGDNLGGVVEGSETVAAPDHSQAYVRNQDYMIDYAAGTITAPSLVGRVVDVGFIAPPITRKTARLTRLNILSSKRPDAPKVLYAIPTFEWSMSTDGGMVRSQRLGGAVRVYLDRPWWSSGDGELLGAVLWQTSRGTPILDRFKPYVTQWGLDPLYRSPATDPLPSLAAFTLSRSEQQGTGVTLDELTDEMVDVAGHSVAFDEGRKLWYSDVKIDVLGGGDSYFPFVRLALARFQPSSVATAHISRVVLADFIQLAPDRFASLTRLAADPTHVDIAVSGLSFQTLRGLAGPSTIEVSLERRRSGVDPAAAEELVWEAVSAPPYTTLTSSAGPGGTTMWTGQVTLPAGPGPFRVVIKEFEVFQAGERRLIYADAIVV